MNYLYDGDNLQALRIRDKYADERSARVRAAALAVIESARELVEDARALCAASERIIAECREQRAARERRAG